MLVIRAGGQSACRHRLCHQIIPLHELAPPVASSSRRNIPHRPYSTGESTSSDSSQAFKPQGPDAVISTAGQQIRRRGSGRSQKQKEHAETFARRLKDAKFLGTTEGGTTHLTGLPTPPERYNMMSPEDRMNLLLQDCPLVSRQDTKPWHAHYRRRYELVFDKIDHAYLVKQLRGMLKTKVNNTYRMNKQILVQQLMLSHGWEVPQDKTLDPEEEQDSHVLDLAENELFLFLRDTRMIRSLMFDKGVTFSVVPGAPRFEGDHRTVLQVSGLKKQLDSMNISLEKRRRNMTLLNVSIDELHGFEPSVNLVQFLSNVTGAFIEPWEERKYRISSMNPLKAELALRLLHVASLRSHLVPPLRGTAVLSPSARDSITTVSLLPFFPSPSTIIPWNFLSTSSSSILYRLRTLANWAPKAGIKQTAHRDEEVENASAMMVVEGNLPSTTASEPFRQFLKGLPVKGNDGENTRKVTTITFGHLLYRNEAESSLSAPISGRWDVTDSQLIFADTKPTPHLPLFTPTLTPAMVHHTLRNPSQHFRRIKYRSHNGTQNVTFTHTYPPPATIEEPELPIQEGRIKSDSGEETEHWLVKLEKMMEDMEKEELEKEQVGEKIMFGEEKHRPAAQDSEQSTSQLSELDANTTAESSSVSPTVNGAAAEANDITSKNEFDVVAEQPTEEQSLNETSSGEKPAGEQQSVNEIMAEEQPVGEQQSLNETVTEEPPTAEVSTSEPILDQLVQPSPLYEGELGQQIETDIMFPDRPVDARLSVQYSSTLSEALVPSTIGNFFQDVIRPLESEAERIAYTKNPPAPPLTVNLSIDESESIYLLESDEDLEVVESYATGGEIVLRHVRSKDMLLGIDKVVSHTELEYEGSDIPERFWRELANTSRDVPPDAASIRTGGEAYSM